MARGKVPAGYKIATAHLRQGDPILKYNTVIGFAGEDIPAGTELFHGRNIAFREFDRDYAQSSEYRPVEPVLAPATFQGIVRPDGRVATRNFIGIISTVNCSATVVHEIADHFTRERLAEFPNVDGVAAFTHALGCGMEMTGEPMQLLRRTLGGYAKHANMAGVLVIGLGCERCQVGGLMEQERVTTAAP